MVLEVGRAPEGDSADSNLLPTDVEVLQPSCTKGFLQTQESFIIRKELELSFPFFLKKYFIYLFMRDTQREAETQMEGEAGSPSGA